MNLFIDTNIFLDFYHLSGPEIEELHKLTALLADGRITLFVPRQLCEELKRNRESKIKDAMNEFKKAKFTINFPAFCKLYPEYREIQDTLKEANAKYAQLTEKVMNDVNASRLKADEVIAELFDKSRMIETSDVIINKARHRFLLGNPPGKKKVTIGDEVNWEALLFNAPSDEDLHLVSGDSDYEAAIDTNKFNAFLDDEWKTRKKSSIIFHKSLQGFFRAASIQIELTSDLKKNKLIEELSTSGSFTTTHLVIDKLASIDNFSSTQVEQLIQIADMNSQVGWIIKDDDVLTFYSKLKENHAAQISSKSLKTLDALIAKNEPAEYDRVSFLAQIQPR